MRVYRTFEGLPNRVRTVVIGNLDGVHVGHQALLNAAQRWEECLTVLTFEPHPKEFFTHTPSRLMRLNEKLRFLNGCGVDEVIVAHFNQEFAQQSGEFFARQIMKNKLHARRVVVGEGFKFGYKQSGNEQTLMEAGVDVCTQGSQMRAGGIVSSTRIRDLIQGGQLAQAEELLGHGFGVRGRVFEGQKLGRTLGFPTANLHWHRSRLPLKGIYAVKVHGVREAHPWPGVASLGERPTVGGTGVWLEVHLLDFNGDLYGRTLSVELCSKLRDEVKFDSLDALVTQMHEDAKQARAILKAGL